MNILQQFNLGEQVPGPNYRKWSGFLNWQREIKLTPEWIKEFDFCDHPYRVIWINITEMSVFTYCEGDLKLQVFNDRVSFYKGLVECAEFYKNN